MISQSTGAVEYTDCISEKKVTPDSESSLDMSVKHQMVRLHFWSFGESGIRLHYHYSQIHPIPEWQYSLGSQLWIKQNYLSIYYSWNHSTMYKQMINGKLNYKNYIAILETILLYEQMSFSWLKMLRNLSLINLQWLICQNITNQPTSCMI